MTGGSGFIGHAFIRLLEEKGISVTNYDLKMPREPVLSTWIPGDILDLKELRKACKEAKPDFVIHLAARADIWSNKREDFRSIDDGTRNVIDAISNIDLKKFIHVSTQLVVRPGAYPKSDDVFDPYTTYGEAKAAAEMCVRNAQLSVPWAIIRPTNIWGPFHPTFAQSVWKYIARRWYLHPNTRDPVMRCYGFIDNSILQMWFIMNWLEQKSSGKVFYLADHALDSSIWLDSFSLELTGKPVRRVPLEILSKLALCGDLLKGLGRKFPIDSGRLYRMTTSYLVPLEPLFNVAGEPVVGLHESVRKTVAWLRSEWRNNAKLNRIQ